MKYYTDSLVAKYMEKEFGVKVRTLRAGTKMKVLGECSSILEPRSGDLIRIAFEGGDFYDTVVSIEPWNDENPEYDPEYIEGRGQKWLYICSDHGGDPIFERHVKEIITRNGKHFFTPEEKV